MTLPSWVGPTRTTPPSEQLPAAELRERPAQLAAPAVRREGGPDSLEPGAGPALPPAEPRCGLGGAREVALSFPLARPFLAHPAGCRSSRVRQSRGESIVGEQEGGAGCRRDPCQPGFFFPGVVAGALSLSFCARAAGWHRPLLCPPGPGQESHLLWHHLLAHPPSHFRQSPQRNAILQDVSSGEPPFVLPVRSLST